MAIRGFKEIVDKKGYKVNAKDRAIFEREVGKSYFGLGISDTIEFIVYDINNNQLPQGEGQKLVRYIPLDVDNIRKYFLITQNPSNMKMNGADEYIIDIEKLITEAGYSNGIFKTQVTLLNRRVGSENIGKDKLWIHEISPTRTEIRVLPLEDENEEVYPDLQKRLDIILNGGNFRDDTIYFVKSMVESIKVEEVIKTFLTLHGTVLSGENYIKLIQTEFKIQSWNLFLNQVREKLIEGAQYFVENKEWNISSNLYGKPLSTPRDLELSVNKIVEILNSILIKVIDKYLPKREIQEENILTIEEQKTLDAVKEILKTVTSGTIYETDAINNNQFVVKGCMNPNALNYNPLATEDDGSCKFRQDLGDGIIPRTDPTAGNLITKTWYAWEDSQIKYKNTDGVRMIKLLDRESISLTYYDGSIKVAEGGDIRETPKPAGSPPPPPDRGSESDGSSFGPTSTGGGASGPTIPVDPVEDNPGQSRNEGAGLARGTRPKYGAQQ